MSWFSKSTQITSFSVLLIQLNLLLFSLVGLTHFPLTCHGCHEQDRRALLDFKSLLSDPSGRLSSWKESNQHRNCCDWQGILCSSDSFRVISVSIGNTRGAYYRIDSHLHLMYFNPSYVPLTGKLSPSIFNITHLEFLDLSYNDFLGSEIPHQLSGLTKLSHLDLFSSNITISEPFANLSALEYIDLSHNFKMESPSIKWVTGLINLKVLRLAGADLSKATSLIQDISHLSNLRKLDLSSCNIFSTSFPIHEFLNLSSLTSLNMEDNLDISFQLPTQLANFTSLSRLDFSGCGLQGSVPYLPQLKKLDVSENEDLYADLTKMFQHQWPKLQSLDISLNSVFGPIPPSISNAPLLVSFSASECAIQGSLPSSIYNLSQLKYLDLASNNITDYIHSSISNLTFLKSFDLGENYIQGSIPESICEILPLRELFLKDNNITGTVPSCISKLRNLTHFDVSGNSIEGNVSLLSLVNDLNLHVLDLTSNKLTVIVDQRFHLYTRFEVEYLKLPASNMEGLFPTFICKLSYLKELDLSQNNLTGVIPSSCFSNLNRISGIDVSNNNFHGPLPLLPKNVLFSLDLSNNKLHGEISIEIGKILSTIRNILLSGNELTGSIPFSICSKHSSSPSSPFIIDLSNNKLSGIIPTSIGYCTDLASINLGHNNLTGNVPNVLGKALSLTFLQLNDNNLDGAPLDFISKFRSLEVLNLAKNKFEGSIPTAFGSLVHLQILSLRFNKFNGSIPEEISHLQQLQILDISQNHLTGPIPKKIGNLTSLINRPNDTESLSNYGSGDLKLQMVIKGIVTQLLKVFRYTSGVDLSCNNLRGKIPDEIGLLKALATLNVSHNNLSGKIPRSVGSMKGLESLDLSFNKFSGHIPQSLTSMDSLGYLDLSYNNLSGRIPRGFHFDTLNRDGSAYTNNSLLCGDFTNNTCEGDQRSNSAGNNTPNEGYEDGKDEAKDELLLYAIIALGFAVGFWGLFFVLLIKKEKWWFGYWRLVDVVAVRVANYLLSN